MLSYAYYSLNLKYNFFFADAPSHQTCLIPGSRRSALRAGIGYHKFRAKQALKSATDPSQVCINQVSYGSLAGMQHSSQLAGMHQIINTLNPLDEWYAIIYDTIFCMIAKYYMFNLI